MKSNDPIITVIIPVLDNKKQFTLCLESVLRNKREQLEIVVIDGGSTDGTLLVIEAYNEYIAYWESGQDSGLADAFNRGISKATGEVIVILNSDDFWEERTVGWVIDACNKFPDSDIYHGGLRFLNEKSNDSYIKKPNLKRMKYRMNIYHPTMFVRRAAYNEAGLYHLNYTHAMDSEWCHRAIRMGLNFNYIPHVLANMRLGGLSDREFQQSLMEYRCSVIQNGLTGCVEGWLYYYFFLAMKFVLQIPWLDYILQKFRRRS